MKKIKIVGLLLFICFAFVSCLSKDNDMELQLKRDKQSREANPYFKEVVGYWHGGNISLDVRADGAWYFNEKKLTTNSKSEITLHGTTFYMEGRFMYFPKVRTEEKLKVEIVDVSSDNLYVKINDGTVTYPLVKGEEPQEVEDILDNLR